MPISTILLVKEDAQDVSSLRTHYLQPLADNGIPVDEVQVLPLLYNTPSKVYAKTAKAYLDKLINIIPDTAVNLIIADSNYFKYITVLQKVSASYGAIVPGAYKGYDRFNCVYVPNYKSLFKQPENRDLISIGIKTIANTNSTVRIDSAEYGLEYGSDREILDSLYQYPVLTVDIETTGLSLDNHIVSIAFAWSPHDGAAIDISINGSHYTKLFFETYRGTIIFHNGLFDAKLLIRNWWMEHKTDYAGMIRGALQFKRAHDTMLLTYLAKNATTQVSLGLKDAALEYVGNYAIEIDDITKYPKQDILKYNLIDALGTFYLWNKYQSEVSSEAYQTIFQPSMYPLLKMMLTGLPIDSHRAQEVDLIFEAKAKTLWEQIQLNPHVISFTEVLRIDECMKANSKLRTKVKPIEDFHHVVFNPGSGPQLIKLLFERLALPVLDTTKTGLPTTGNDTLSDLSNHTTDEDTLELLVQIQELADVLKIKNTFIKPFLREPDWVHGNLKLGGTQSGRLSSNDPNLTNLPAHGKMGKIVKSCVKAPKGYLLAGADFSALEERIGAILSQDPQRIKVYTDGYDGHSMRAQKYFGDQMPDIVKALQKAETATEFWIDDEGEYQCE